MSASSGVNVTEFKAWRTCGACLFESRADVWYDPETRAHGWQCATCNTEHVKSR